MHVVYLGVQVILCEGVEHLPAQAGDDDIGGGAPSGLLAGDSSAAMVADGARPLDRGERANTVRIEYTFGAVNMEAMFWPAARPVSQLSGPMASWKIVSTPRAFNADFRYRARINTEACVLDEFSQGCINGAL